MIRTFVLATLIFAVSTSILVAQPTMPRRIFIRVTDETGSPLDDDLESLRFETKLNGSVRYDNSFDFGFIYAGGNVYAKIQLGNYGVYWTTGDTLTVSITQSLDILYLSTFKIIIPEGYDTVWWGRPCENGKSYPGEAAKLLPCILEVETDSNKQYKILRNGVETGFETGQDVTAKNVNTLSGIYALEAPDKGWHWEPARKLVSLDDFILQSSNNPVNGERGDYYEYSIQFRLVKDE